jgi:outer membrane receptor protein involved in Fe transport
MASVCALALMAALTLPAFATPAFAQATTGSVRGVVTDQTGAVVPEAKITAKNQATGVESPAFRSTADGIYNLSSLTPGKYTLTVEANNFKKSVFTDVEIRLGETLTLDVSLEPGGVSETVTVTAGTEEVVKRETAQVSSSFDARKVSELPSNAAGGGIDTLALLAPGVVPGLAGNSNGTTLSVNGNRSRSNNFTIDGQDNNDLAVAGPSFFVTNQDAVADFQVITNNFSAEYGRNQGAIVNIVTKSGTNDFHGSAFEFHRNQKLFDTQTNLERRSRIASDPSSFEAPPLLSNIFGGTVGGPVLRDRAFFFASYQGIRQSATTIGRGAGLALLPEEFTRIKARYPNNSAIAALADFGAFAITDFGNVRPRTDLANPFGTITLPINPALPATGANAATFQAAFPERSFSTPFTQDEVSVRGDVKLTDKDSVWGSYLYQESNNGNALGASNGFTGDIPANTHKTGVTWNRQLSNTALNTFFFSYSRLLVDFGGGCEGLKGCIPGSTSILDTFSTLNPGGVRTTAGAAGGLQTLGGGNNLPQGRLVQVYQFSDTLRTTRGRHSITAGADIRRLVNESTVLFDFNGTYTTFNPTRLVQNNPGSVTFAAGEPTIQYNETDQFYFFQDDWKIKDNLTLNLGVRYEYTGQPVNELFELTQARESDPQQAFFRQNLPIESRIVPKLAADKNNWAPRIGFAYTPRFAKEGILGKIIGDDATVIRGGYSVAYDPAFYNILIFLSTSTPVVFNNLVANPTTGAVLPVPSARPTAGALQQFVVQNNLVARNVFDPRLLSQSVLPQDFHSPYAQQWSLGVQRQIGRTNVFEVRYLGTHGVGLFQNRDANPRIDRLANGFTRVVGGQTITFPGFPNLVPQGVTPLSCVDNTATRDNEAACNGRILAGRGITTETGNHAQSLYHSLQANYNGRLFNQLTIGSAYTLSKAIDTTSEVVGLASAGSFSQAAFNITASERGYAGFDRRHVFSVNGIWDIPAFKDQKGVIGHLLGGWQLNSVYLISSGRRYTIANGFNNTLNALGVPVYSQQVTADRFRPFFGNGNADRTQVGITGIDVLLGAAAFGWNTAGVSPTTALYLLNDLNNGVVTPVSKTDVYAIINGPGSTLLFGNPYGDIPRNSEVAPRINQLNAGFFKTTNINERVKVQFRAEVFNLLNHPQPGYGTTFVNATFPDRNAINAGFQDGFNDFGGIEYARRVVQFGLRVVF